jgi:hypothetical protein
MRAIARCFIPILFATAVAVVAPALAQSRAWTLVGETEMHSMFADFATLTVNGATRQAWMLVSANAPSMPGAPSFTSLREFDCQGSRYRNLQVIRYDSIMGRGNVTSMDKMPTSWLPAIPRGAAEHALRNVCKR